MAATDTDTRSPARVEHKQGAATGLPTHTDALSSYTDQLFEQLGMTDRIKRAPASHRPPGPAVQPRGKNSSR